MKTREERMKREATRAKKAKDEAAGKETPKDEALGKASAKGEAAGAEATRSEGAGHVRQDCKTRYPLVLIHGIGYNDTDYPNYWGRIPKTLRAHGARVFFGEQSSYAAVTENARQLRKRILDLCREEDCEKVNLIAHSKGGLEARYMISRLGMGERVASLTTIATPHRGVPAIDELKAKDPRRLGRLFRLFGLMLRIDGGDLPENWGIYEQLSADYMDVFNEMVPDDPRVYYQSWACDMVDRHTDPALGLFYELVKRSQGANDGFVPVDSAQWGEFRGIYTGPEGKGISHPMACDGRTRQMERRGLGDITRWYVEMVAELAEKGY